MGGKEMDGEAVRQLLLARCAEAGGQSAFARAHGFSVQYVSQVIQGKRPPSEGMCDVLGIRCAGMRWTKQA